MTESAADRLWRRAQHYRATGQIDAARASLESLLARDPAYIHAHLILSAIAWKQDRMRDAVRHSIDAARVVPEDALSLLTVVTALLQVGEIAAARRCLQSRVFSDLRDIDLLLQAGALSHLLGDHPRSLQFYDRSAEAGMDELNYCFDRAVEMSFNGRLQEAEAELERCAARGSTNGRVYVELSRLSRQTPEHNHLAMLEQRVAQVASGSPDHGTIEFARYNELESLGRHDEAWQALVRGNEVMAARTRFDAAREERLHGRLREVFSALAAGNGCTDAGPSPIFVVGMTRSGTTLLDRILGNHSLVESAGELADFSRQLRHVAGRCTQEILDERTVELLPGVDYAEVGARYLAQTQWRANGRPYFVDKLPFNWMFAGLIKRALPRARILHLVRDPLDVCFSNLRAFFGLAHGWSYDQEKLAAYYRQYRVMMDYWHSVMPGQILDVNYADLVAEPERTTRNVFDFCGLNYEEGCLDLSRNRTAVATLSLAQVRGGIQARTGDWYPYEARLAPLREALASI